MPMNFTEKKNKTKKESNKTENTIYAFCTIAFELWKKEKIKLKNELRK